MLILKLIKSLFPKNPEAKEIIKVRVEDCEFFRDLFGEDVKQFEYGSRIYNMIEKALNTAHDIRKFEIELYWKRAAYFFAFFTVVTGSFGYLITNENFIFLSPALAIVGVFISLCFYYVNIGSKYWQCNWEHVIDRLEYYVSGNLYKLYFFDGNVRCKPSVSDINQSVSFVIIVSWLCLFILSIYKIKYFFCLSLIYCIIFLCVFFAVNCRFSRTIKDVRGVRLGSNEFRRGYVYYRLREPRYRKFHRL